jgi:hypothetical protein
MPNDDPDDDEDWYDAEAEPDDEEAAPCPECGEPVHSVTSKCPACGYWLSPHDRRAASADESKPLWLKLTTIILLTVFLLSALGIAAIVF